MYDVCIADDEVLIQQSITARIKESKLPLRVLGCAVNAESALNLYWSIKPDIFLVDINMPRIDGLSLIRRIREEDPGCSVKFIIITGYDDFPHLREAIQSGVMDYLKKPIATEEFNTVLAEAIKQIQQKKKNDAIPKNGFIYYEDYITEKNRFLMSGLAIAFYYSSAELITEENSASIREALLKLPVIGGKSLSLCFRNTDNATLWYFPCKVISKGELNFLLNPLLQKQHISAAYTYSETEQIEVLMGRLEESLNIRFIRPGLDTGFLAEACPRQSRFSFDPAMLEYVLENGKINDAVGIVEAQITKVTSDVQTIGELCSLYRQIMYLLINKYIDHNIPILSSMKLEPAPFVLCNFATLQALKAFLAGATSSLAGAIGVKSPKGELIQEVIEYLRQHYRDEISLLSLSREFFVTPPYLSRRFKEKTGIAFVEYLEELRLEKAEEYLLGSEAKIIDISEKVGYSDPNYFAKVFKKKYGFSPSDYREASH